MDHDDLETLRRAHPAWRLLASDLGPLVIGFAHQRYLAANARSYDEQALAAHLEDYLHGLRDGDGDSAYPRRALDYLREWADDAHGWLRRYYPPDADEPHYDLTPATEQAVQWVRTLQGQQFIGAESRLKLVFDLLRQIAEGTETDPAVRIAELERRRAALDAEIDRVRAGRLDTLDPTQLRERFLQAQDTARALLADFRQVEQNFRDLDRQVRARIATWDGGKGALLEEVFGEQDAITDSDQGRSFRAFWDFLISPARQEELTALMERILALGAVAALRPDPRLARIHYDWLAAGEVTQRTVSRLSEQLRRFLDDQAWLENRRIMTVIRGLEQHALAVRNNPPPDGLMALDEPGPTVDLPMERPLYSPPATPRIAEQALQAGDADVDAGALYEQVYVDKERLRARLRLALQTRRQVSLVELLEAHPLEQGLAELVSWLAIATGEGQGVIDETQRQTVSWTDSRGHARRATVPGVVFVLARGVA